MTGKCDVSFKKQLRICEGTSMLASRLLLRFLSGDFLRRAAEYQLGEQYSHRQWKFHSPAVASSSPCSMPGVEFLVDVHGLTGGSSFNVRVQGSSFGNRCLPYKRSLCPPYVTPIASMASFASASRRRIPRPGSSIHGTLLTLLIMSPSRSTMACFSVSFFARSSSICRNSASNSRILFS